MKTRIHGLQLMKVIKIKMLQLIWGQSQLLKGFTYLPSQDRWAFGTISKYIFEVSLDGKNWKKVSEGPPGAAERPGDIAFWDYGTPVYPYSHVAIVERDTGGQLVCLTQNPGRTQTATLTKAGLIGYLRPKQFNPPPNPLKPTTQTPTIEEIETMKTAGFYYKRKDGKTINIIMNPVSEFFHDYEANDGGYNSPVAAAFGTGNFAKISESHANKLAADAAKVREGK